MNTRSANIFAEKVFKNFVWDGKNVFSYKECISIELKYNFYVS